MKKVLLIIAILSVTLVSFSCKETKAVVNTASNVNLAGSYNVASINGVATTNQNQTLSFNAIDKLVSGNSGCNTFSGSYSIDVLALSFGVMTATEAYCDEEIMTQERNFFNALKNTGSYGIKEGTLSLYSKTDRSVILKAKRAN